jgi:hypothetical protein
MPPHSPLEGMELDPVFEAVCRYVTGDVPIFHVDGQARPPFNQSAIAARCKSCYRPWDVTEPAGSESVSAERESFHASILGKRYAEAVITLNGLNMEEMLLALASIGKHHRGELVKAFFGAFDSVNNERIRYAFQVVRDLRVPDGPAPGDLQQTDQVDDAKRFVAIPKITPRFFSRADDAAVAVISAINPTSIAQNREFWGLIFQQREVFGFTTPTRSPDETAATPIFNFPPGTTGIALYHTHGAGFERINGSKAAEIFTLDDRIVCKRNNVDGYVGTPQTHILKLTKPPASERANMLELGKASTLR